MTLEATEAVSKAIIVDSSSRWTSLEMTECLETTISRASLSLTKDSTRARTRSQSKSSASSPGRTAAGEAAAWACPSEETVAAEATAGTEVVEATEETEVAVMATEEAVSEGTEEMVATVADSTMATGTEAVTGVTGEASAAEAT